eukprot:TRINITY_DN1384_c0_g1_i3.p1 TRINITY_DN1384_c0_g1~~TRINITY_DN1384_c0_g1_i3.p1  ORF type:complete len:426 (-),score=100.96 TRINITY_DN1384_c0_g1_i3:460-1737(-)
MSVSVEMRPTKLFIGGISQNTTTKDLRVHFGQYGRVLDCVAMRKDDGRSRSFGYVTLDSPEAADKCISGPQTIDGRTVDVKRAVPERAPRDKTTVSSATEKVTPKTKGRARSTTRSSVDTIIGGDVDLAGLFMELNADAPEFTPMGDDATPSFTRKDSVLDESSSTALESAAAMLKIGAPPGLSLPVTGLPTSRSPPPGFALPPPGFAPLPPKRKTTEPGAEDSEKALSQELVEESSTAPPSQSTTPTTVTVECTDELTDEEEQEDYQAMMPDGELPSAGSALHFLGQCRPCNFFGKGRCGNALDCEFCHMSHQKRKPTRQEKRERKAAWLARHVDGVAKRTEMEVSDMVAKVASVAAPALVHFPEMHRSAPCGINFDNYSDFSDDEDSIASPTGAVVDKESDVQWSRESLLRVRVAIMSTQKED